MARNFICFGKSDGVVVVCDATCLERNLNLVLQTMEISDRVLVCVNLLDEAARKNITIDLDLLSENWACLWWARLPERKRAWNVFWQNWMNW